MAAESRVGKILALGVGVIVLIMVFPLARDGLRRLSDDRHADAVLADRAADGVAVVTAPDDPSVWATFRGPDAAGISREVGLLSQWPDGGPSELYRQPIGGGHAGFVVSHGRAITMEQRKDKEAVVAYDLHTGKELWSHTYTARFSESMGGDGPRATPTLHEGTVYSLGAAGDLVALSLEDGTRRWHHNVLEELEANNLQWALAGSPLVVDGKVVVASSGLDSAGFIAYDAQSGDEVWTSDWMVQGYTSPVVATVAERRVILHLAGEALVALDPASGDEVWSHPWKTFKEISAAQPLLAGDDRVYISTGYGTGSGLVKVRANGGGFITESVWTTTFMQNKFNSSVLVDGVVYGLHDGVLAAQDVETGASLWEGERYGHGQILYADGRLIVLAEDGTLMLHEVSRDGVQPRGRVEALRGRTWAVPALAGGRLLIRNEREMVVYDLRARGDASVE